MTDGSGMHAVSSRLSRLRRQVDRLPKRTTDGWEGPGKNTFLVNRARLHEINELIDDYGVAEDSRAEWPNNVLSKRTVIYTCGAFSRSRYVPRFDVDSNDLVLCKRISAEAKNIVGEMYIGFGDASDHPLVPFFVAANSFDTKPRIIDADLIRTRFAGTLFPPFMIKIDPLSQTAEWFVESQEPTQITGNVDPATWAKVIEFFTSQAELTDTAFVSVGTEEERRSNREDMWPPGTVLPPCVLPRMVLGLTSKGSICGLLGWGVWK